VGVFCDAPNASSSSAICPLASPPEEPLLLSGRQCGYPYKMRLPPKFLFDPPSYLPSTQLRCLSFFSLWCARVRKFHGAFLFVFISVVTSHSFGPEPWRLSPSLQSRLWPRCFSRSLLRRSSHFRRSFSKGSQVSRSLTNPRPLRLSRCLLSLSPRFFCPLTANICFDFVWSFTLFDVFPVQSHVQFKWQTHEQFFFLGTLHMNLVFYLHTGSIFAGVRTIPFFLSLSTLIPTSPLFYMRH